MYLFVGADLGYRVGCDRCDCVGWVGTTDVVEDGHHYSRPQGVRTLRERAYDGQMGHGMFLLYLFPGISRCKMHNVSKPDTTICGSYVIT